MTARPLVVTRFVAVTPEAAARLREDPAALARLREGPRDEVDLDRYAHGVQYLLAGKAQGVRPPLAWFTAGGEPLGDTAAGPARYLSPEQVSELSAALADVAPDDLGDDTYDEAAMDAAGVEPGGWARAARTSDPLGTMRELYAYLQEALARLSRARQGVVVLPEPAPGLDDLDEDDEDDEDEKQAPLPVASPAAPPLDEVVLRGAKDRTYARAREAPTPDLDATMTALAYRPLGDVLLLPSRLPLRCYLSADGRIVLTAVVDEGRVASTTFLARLKGDAVVVASDAFVQDKVKRRVFATMLSTAAPAQLDAAVRERCAALAAKHGEALQAAPTLEAAAAAWEAWLAKLDKK